MNQVKSSDGTGENSSSNFNGDVEITPKTSVWIMFFCLIYFCLYIILPRFVDGVLSSSVIEIRSRGKILNIPLSVLVEAGCGFVFKTVCAK